MSPFETMINQINDTHGLTVRGLMTEGSNPAVRNFNRKHAEPLLLGSSFREVMDSLRVRKLALPIRFSSDTYDRLINLAVGHGYVGRDLNPNPAGLGLVTSKRGLALGTPWSDAPAWGVVYVDPSNRDVRVTSSGTGIWNMLPHNTVAQTVALVQDEVEQLGGLFSIQNLWVATSPGVRDKGDAAFRLNEKAKQETLSSGATAPYLEEFLHEEKSSSEPERPYVLDLSGLTAALWLDQGIDPDKFFFDPRANADVSSASKRAAEARGEKGWSSELMALTLA